ncbi:MAG: signal recognition particle-docking protein FtsY [Candidatus Nanoarchaeia archaeon]
MFGYLKEKLKGAVDKFSSDVDEESPDASEDESKKQDLKTTENKEQKEKKKVETKALKEDSKKEQKEALEKKEEEKEEEQKYEEDAEKEDKGGWFSRLWKKKDEKPSEVEEVIAEKKDGKVKSGEQSLKDTKEDKGEEPSLSTKEEKPKKSHKESAKKEESHESTDGVLEEKQKVKEKKPQVDSSDELKESLKKESENLAESQINDKKKPIFSEDERETNEEVKADSEGEENKGFFGRFRDSVYDAVTKKSISEKKFDELFWDIEMVLLENNVAVEVIEKIKADLKKELVEKKIRRGRTVELITDTLKDSINELFVERLDLIEKINQKKPYVITFVGVNGSGKTTSIAKLAYKLKQMGYNPVIAAADTFRAAAIQQLEEHANNIDVKMIKHDYGADPAAVCFDAIKYANSRKMDVVLIDTAGRLHSNTNLVDEMKKIVRVAQPDLKIFVGESTTGNDCIEQAQRFNEAIGIDGIILAKTDVDSKGGAAISVSYVTGKPIIYIGTGQDYKDLTEFEPNIVVKNLGLSA